MALVSYSDSEASEDEGSRPQAAKQSNKPTSNFSVDKTNPGTIKVSLPQQSETPLDDLRADEPPSKRQRVGEGPFGGFNSFLPAPKRDNVPQNQTTGIKPSSRKVFSLKTGAEASFSREADSELRTFFSEQSSAQSDAQGADGSIATTAKPMPSFAKPAKPSEGGKLFMFKPLSVPRNQKKKKPGADLQTVGPRVPKSTSTPLSSEPPDATGIVPKKKISLFSVGTDDVTPIIPAAEELEIDASIDQDNDLYPSATNGDLLAEENNQYPPPVTQPESLDTIASDLNLSAAQRRQLFGRSGQNGGSAVSVVNFNTDVEYAANQALIASGETVQHNPVRSIAPGKHSLRKLVNVASGQKEALEESFAEGRRNKKEAGSKYGW